ncbi:MAG: hypothetical protein JL50_21645 [Peptococcaceae bacterium BICA1-7]|nr:MAG: hypothetical protein JL50_21645 [Peptococcaceae bacterium BICA1-7]
MNKKVILIVVLAMVLMASPVFASVQIDYTGGGTIYHLFTDRWSEVHRFPASDVLTRITFTPRDTGGSFEDRYPYAFRVKSGGTQIGSTIYVELSQSGTVAFAPCSNISVEAQICSGHNSSWTMTVDMILTKVGYIADIGDIQPAINAANAAKTSADISAAQASASLNAVSNVSGNTVSAVRDASGTVLSEARQAKTNSQIASTNSSQASTNAQNAYNTAQTVNTKVDSLTAAVNQINTSIIGVNDDNTLVSAVRDPGGTVLSVSKDTQGAVEDLNGNTITAIRDSNGTVLDASRSANEKIDTLQTTVNNYMSSDTSPPVIKLNTVSGARATSGSSIKIIVSASDNISSNFSYSLDDTTYQPLPVDRIITVPLIGFGSIPINIWVKDEAGNIGMDCIVIRRI